MADTVGLPVLLSRVLGGLTVALDPGDRVASLAVWSNVLRCVGDGCAERYLAPATRISKRLAVAAVKGAARRRWITVDAGQIALAPAGQISHRVWQAALDALDAEWSATELRAALEALVAQLPLELPYFPASYGAADPSAIGGSFVPAHGDLPIPAHGQDWKPVLRAEGDTVSAVPLTGLLSQALVAFAIEYEARPAWPLASTTLVVRHLHAEPTPLADVPGDHGIAGNGKSLLERHGIALVTRDPTNSRHKLVQLTPRGILIRDHHEAWVSACEAAWSTKYGADVVDGLRAALTAHPSAADVAIPDHVVGPLHLG